MRNALFTTAASVAIVMGALTFAPVNEAAAADAATLEEGKKLSFDRRKGNCLACHMIEGGDLPGNIGPPLIAMKARFPDKAVLRAQIYDARTKNANTIMPPFGPHAVMSEEEIDKVVEFIHTL